jgi:hypothetical protein
MVLQPPPITSFFAANFASEILGGAVDEIGRERVFLNRKCPTDFIVDGLARKAAA